MSARLQRVLVLTLVALGLALAGCKADQPVKKEEGAKKEAPAKVKPEEGKAEEGKETPALEKAREPAVQKTQEPATSKSQEPAAEKSSEEARTAEKPVAQAKTEDPMPIEPDEVMPALAKAELKSAEEAESAMMVIREPSKKMAQKKDYRLSKQISSRTVVGTLGSDSGAAFGGAMLDGAGMGAGGAGVAPGLVGAPGGMPQPVKEVPGTEDYDSVSENEFKKALDNPLSTFSIDVDTASYSNMRRFINQLSRLPPQDSVRIEEFINYFTYDYPLPEGDVPFSVTTELSDCPWNDKNRLAMVGLQGKRPPESELPPSNLVFLIDSSGSMSSARKMGLLKQGFKMLVGRLRKEDRVAIVTYAGSAGLVLPSTPGTRKDEILAALDKLRAGGSTAGAAGIELAYKVALDNFEKKGNNRVILASDGDFNVGLRSRGELERMIEEKRDKGVFLTILGFGMGNYKDSRMETLADKGNGNYAYIDDILEAKKVFVTEMTGTLFTIAKDVKIQIEFNPTRVAEYRLVGYENRMLKKEDFADDTKDAGELGAGHTVTALYEIVPAGQTAGAGEELKYVKTEVKPEAAASNELMTVKLRYKLPDGDKSKLIEQPVPDTGLALAKTSNNFRWAMAVAAFGQILRQSKFSGSATLGNVLMWAKGAKGDDHFGYRAEFIQLVEKALLMK